MVLYALQCCRVARWFASCEKNNCNNNSNNNNNNNNFFNSFDLIQYIQSTGGVWWVSRAGPMLFHWPKLLDPFLSSIVVDFLYFLSIGWYCGAGVFRLIGCKLLLPSLALPTSFNSNNYNNNN